ncbi:hypothetical protein DFQ27_004767 [Actinomortierella ambigua]|uniref:Uncharacterized protein n=1 Tax=Actinomortierella ambigua TaxID=1343610 RepID=A0A9P6Q143_9FUNG|nr:hypothetical protein DFQ27_004767 [Actinomortierella ambigua]
MFNASEAVKVYVAQDMHINDEKAPSMATDSAHFHGQEYVKEGEKPGGLPPGEAATVVVVARQSFSAVASGAIFVGEDTADPDATPSEIFKNPSNHAAAAASVLAFLAERAQFTPSEAPAKSLEQPFLDFMKRASTFSGFQMKHNAQFMVRLTGSLIQLEQMVREVVIDNKVLIGRGIRDLVPGYIPDKTLDMWTLSLIVIEKPRGSEDVRIQLVHISLDITTDEDYTAIIPVQRAKVMSSVFKVNQSYLTSQAEALVKIIPTMKVRRAIDFLTSPKVISKDETFAAACRGML